MSSWERFDFFVAQYFTVLLEDFLESSPLTRTRPADLQPSHRQRLAHTILIPSVRSFLNLIPSVRLAYRTHEPRTINRNPRLSWLTGSTRRKQPRAQDTPGNIVRCCKLVVLPLDIRITLGRRRAVLSIGGEERI